MQNAIARCDNIKLYFKEIFVYISILPPGQKVRLRATSQRTDKPRLIFIQFSFPKMKQF